MDDQHRHPRAPPPPPLAPPLAPGCPSSSQGSSLDHSPSRYRTSGGSNKACAARYAATTGHSTTGAPEAQLWGPQVHETGSGVAHAAAAAEQFTAPPGPKFDEQ